MTDRLQRRPTKKDSRGLPGRKDWIPESDAKTIADVMSAAEPVRRLNTHDRGKGTRRAQRLGAGEGEDAMIERVTTGGSANSMSSFIGIACCSSSPSCFVASHECRPMWVALATGMKGAAISLGLRPDACGRTRRGENEYGVKALPAGGEF